MKIKVVFDNYRYADGFVEEWGFSAIVYANGKRILFDTGSNGEILLHNLKQFGESPEGFDFVFISHDHWDHTGGLSEILSHNEGIPVIVHEKFSPPTLNLISKYTDKITQVSTEPVEIEPDFFSTGYFNSSPEEHSLVITENDRIFVFVGCSHPSIENILSRVKTRFGTPHFAIGGTHIYKFTDSERRKIAEETLKIGTEYISATHCTGRAGIKVFKEVFGERYIEAGVGREITF